jgi:hypothetical protein
MRGGEAVVALERGSDAWSGSHSEYINSRRVLIRKREMGRNSRRVMIRKRKR